MSDPVMNVEIEDVLSSIRRLVSSEDRSAKPEVAPQKIVPSEPERLVLTPSLRVDAPEPFVAEAADKLKGDNIADDEMVGDKAPHDKKTADDFATAKDVVVSEAPFVFVDADSASGPDVPTLKPTDVLKARVAEFEEVVARQRDQWDPDGASADANSGDPRSALPWEDYVVGSDAEDTSHDSDIAKGATQAIADQVEVAGDEVGPKEEVAEAESDVISDNFAADDSPQSTQEAAAEGARAAAPKASGEDDFLSANDDFLDEDALRDLVADIVRQELQGALGERITRNVRKLVRR